MFLLLSNSRSLRAPWPTIRKGFGLGGCSSNCCSLLWWSSPPCDPIYIFHGKPAGASWWFAEVNAFIYNHTISVFIPKLERPDKSLDKNHFKIFVNRGRRRWKWHTHFPKLHIRVFAADAGEGESPFSWDTDGIPFIVDNAATSIIRSKRKLFTGNLSPMSITLETAKGMSVSTKLVGVLRLVLTEDSNKHHIYDVTGCVYDP